MGAMSRFLRCQAILIKGEFWLVETYEKRQLSSDTTKKYFF